MEFEIKIGQSAKIEKVVQIKDTAKAFSSGLAEVFSTPSMIALMENAAYAAVQKYLPQGFSTVGISIDAKHLAATPVGLKVWAEAVLTQVDGRKFSFEINAYDEREKIGRALHERFVIDQEKFMKKAGAKVGASV